jgi:hypothetical protein
MSNGSPSSLNQPGGQPAAKPPPRMRLDAIRTGRLIKPVRVLVVGVEGVGKSTFAANAPSPVFLAPEDGTASLDVARLPEPQHWTDIFDAVELLSREAHSFKTLVVDTVDWAEPLCWKSVCEDGKKSSIEDFGYGKGYTAALERWRMLLSRLDALRERKGMHIILLAHAQVRTFKNPDIEIGDYDRYELKLHQKTSGVLKEWSDAVLFANYETLVKRDKDNDLDHKSRGRGIFDGKRVLHTTRHAAWDAKNRYELPHTIPLSWEAFWSHARPFVEGVRSVTEVEPTSEAGVLRSRIDALVPQLLEGDQKTARAWLSTPSASDAVKLEEFLAKLKTKIPEKNNEKADKAATKEVSK